MQHKTMKVCNIAIVLSSILVGASTQPNAQCLNNQPIWSNCNDSDSNFCGDNLWWSLRCDKLNQVWIQPCYCIYYDKKYKTAIAGQCIHTCFYLHPSLETGSFHFPIQRYPVENYSLFNQDMCDVLPDLNREGRFCGKCKEKYGASSLLLPLFLLHTLQKLQLQELDQASNCYFSH